MAHLITGYAGYEHIQSEDDGAFNAAVFGQGQYVLEINNQFAGSIIDNNTVRIMDGDGLMYGRHFRISPSTYEDVPIVTGTAGTNRIDLICMTYEKNANDETETCYLEVIQGTATSGTASAPAYTDGNILEGATKNQMPLYKVTLEGVVLAKIEAMFETVPTYARLAKLYADQFKADCKAYIDSLDVIDSMTEIEANTEEDHIAGALAVKELAVDVKAAQKAANNAQTKSDSAEKLANARTIQTNLGSTAADSFDGSANVKPGVTGTLPITNGGTGATTAANARSNLGVPPTSHASSATTYGAGNASNYGHVKLSDSVSSASGASGGIAATPAAVKNVATELANTNERVTKLEGVKIQAMSLTSTGITVGAGETVKCVFTYDLTGHTMIGASAYSAGVKPLAYSVYPCNTTTAAVYVRNDTSEAMTDRDIKLVVFYI